MMTEVASPSLAPGLHFPRSFAPLPGPYHGITWNKRTARVLESDGSVVFEQTDVEAPDFWSDQTINVVAQKYFRGPMGSPERENSVRGLIDRVARTIGNWAQAGGYFQDEASVTNFVDDLTWLLVHQYFAFNSPVWFNVGIEPRPQCSACFINSVDDSMSSILDLVKEEGTIFKYGSGAGVNLSNLRSSKELLSGGGEASGPVSFMRGFDSFAGAIKSGGKTRRAAKMVILDADHPDIFEFVESKEREEEKMRVLIKAGYDGSFNGEAQRSVFFQNGNHSVRVTDAFMKAVKEDLDWQVTSRTTGEVLGEFKARKLFKAIAKAANACGCPGLQFHDTINLWHTCKASGDIVASNPCSEYLFLNDTSCNLASLNLMKFRLPGGFFDHATFQKAVDVVITAQEILIDRASYPTSKIGEETRKYRTLGLGYANLGAYLMSIGLPYDSLEARTFSAMVTSLMSARAYRMSAIHAANLGPFAAYTENSRSMLTVLESHRDAHEALPAHDAAFNDLYHAGADAWVDALVQGQTSGYRNAQISVLAPTGTIAFLMGCDTTGVEPDIALVKYKKLAGKGGMLKMVNQRVAMALEHLRYSPGAIQRILTHIEETDTIEGAADLKREHLPVFDCAFKPANGSRYISHEGHLRMMAAVQPFLSGAISKTVNLPKETTDEEIEKIYFLAWELGLKAVAIFRDGSKALQAVSTSSKEQEAAEVVPVRKELPRTRSSITHEFSLDGHKGYLTVGLNEQAQPKELFVCMSKGGSTVSGLMGEWAKSVSISLQHGVPLEAIVKAHAHTRFEPAGFTGNKDLPKAKSPLDYISRWLEGAFLNKQVELPKVGVQEAPVASQVPARAVYQVGPPCPKCSTLMTPRGACHTCDNCGDQSSC